MQTVSDTGIITTILAIVATKMILDDGDVFYRLNYRQPYHVHLAITNLLIVLAIISLVVKIAKTPRIYRSKYIFILIILVFVGIVDTIYVSFGGICRRRYAACVSR